VLVDDQLPLKVKVNEIIDIEIMDVIRNKPGKHYVNLIGINRNGPWVFHWRLDVNGTTTPGWDLAPDGRAPQSAYVYHFGLEITPSVIRPGTRDTNTVGI
jgi:hypothetical protein